MKEMIAVTLNISWGTGKKEEETECKVKPVIMNSQGIPIQVDLSLKHSSLELKIKED